MPLVTFFLVWWSMRKKDSETSSLEGGRLAASQRDQDFQQARQERDYWRVEAMSCRKEWRDNEAMLQLAFAERLHEAEGERDKARDREATVLHMLFDELRHGASVGGGDVGDMIDRLEYDVANGGSD